MQETELNLHLISLRKELSGVLNDKEQQSTNTQELPMQFGDLPSDSILENEVTSLFSDSFQLEPLKLDDSMMRNNIPASEDSLMAKFSFTSELMDIGTSGLHELLVNVSEGENCKLFKTESPSPLYVCPIVSSSINHNVVMIPSPVTPTSGPTPIMTPIHSVTSSPCGSLYSGYSSGWGPPSPPGKDVQRKKRSGVHRPRTRINPAVTPVTSTHASTPPVTSTYHASTPPVISPVSSIPPSPTDCKHSAREFPVDYSNDTTQQRDSKVPRHKRPSHIRAEHKRRDKIQGGLEDLKTLIPSVSEVFQNGGKESKSAVLLKAVDHCRQLRTETRGQSREIQTLKRELESLTLDINDYQKLLPEGGAEVEQATPSQDINQMFRDYVSSRALGNWKFWIFGMLIIPVFETYNNTVVTKDRASFCSSVIAWLEKSCSLVHLRPVVFQALRNLSTKTSVMTAPEKLPQEAIDDVMQANFSAKLDSL